ncbi:hypothetical protein [Streptomyces buecherae]|uniref:hypothetical protein n=1 Tax=Streptomyces buecherae TaxID=2763006 RepID=UPI00164E0C28|nr:hypothetical protein [Streptomyces buecherae]QNJ43708.1 hypothetical protein H7H31_31580 [Streptomyces buecherae]
MPQALTPARGDAMPLARRLVRLEEARSFGRTGTGGRQPAPRGASQPTRAT